VIGDLATHEPDTLILSYSVIHFWCMDAILRLSQKDAAKEDEIDWDDVLKRLARSVRRFDLDLLVRVTFKTKDINTILDLIKIWVCLEEYSDEIFERLGRFKFSKPFLKYLQKQGNDRELGKLLSVTASQIRAWIKSMRLDIKESDMNL